MVTDRLYLVNMLRFTLFVFIFTSVYYSSLTKYNNITLQQAEAKAPLAPLAPPKVEGMVVGTITSLEFFEKSLNLKGFDISLLPHTPISEQNIDNKIEQNKLVEDQRRTEASHEAMRIEESAKPEMRGRG